MHEGRLKLDRGNGPILYNDLTVQPQCRIMLTIMLSPTLLLSSPSPHCSGSEKVIFKKLIWEEFDEFFSKAGNKLIFRFHVKKDLIPRQFLDYSDPVISNKA